MKEKDEFENEIVSRKPININDLLEPLVEENKLNNSKKKDINLLQSVHLPNNNYEPPNEKNKFLHNSINVSYTSNNPNNQINRIRKEIKELNKDNETEISNYSNLSSTETIKIQNFNFLIILTIFSSLQFGIYIFIFNLYINTMPIYNTINNNLNIINISNKGLFYSFFLVLSWKYQIYLIIYIIYASFIYFKFKKNVENKNNYENLNEDSSPLINRSNSFTSKDNFINSFKDNPTFKFREFKYKYLEKFGYNYKSYFNIFISTSNIFNIQENDKIFLKIILIQMKL